jgi:hypothetical protein
MTEEPEHIKPPDSAAAVKSIEIQASQSQAADITIVTAEGDTVTLSARKSEELSYSTYNSQGKADDSNQMTSAESAGLVRTSGFSFSVPSTTVTASSHISILIQTQAQATPDDSTSGLWWFPSQAPWNIQQTKQDPVAQTEPSPALENPATT